MHVNPVSTYGLENTVPEKNISWHPWLTSTSPCSRSGKADAVQPDALIPPHVCSEQFGRRTYRWLMCITEESVFNASLRWLHLPPDGQVGH